MADPIQNPATQTTQTNRVVEQGSQQTSPQIGVPDYVTPDYGKSDLHLQAAGKAKVDASQRLADAMKQVIAEDTPVYIPPPPLIPQVNWNFFERLGYGLAGRGSELRAADQKIRETNAQLQSHYDQMRVQQEGYRKLRLQQLSTAWAEAQAGVAEAQAEIQLRFAEQEATKANQAADTVNQEAAARAQLELEQLKWKREQYQKGIAKMERFMASPQGEQLLNDIVGLGVGEIIYQEEFDDPADPGVKRYVTQRANYDTDPKRFQKHYATLKGQLLGLAADFGGIENAPMLMYLDRLVETNWNSLQEGRKQEQQIRDEALSGFDRITSDLESFAKTGKVAEPATLENLDMTLPGGIDTSTVSDFFSTRASDVRTYYEQNDTERERIYDETRFQLSAGKITDSQAKEKMFRAFVGDVLDDATKLGNWQGKQIWSAVFDYIAVDGEAAIADLESRGCPQEVIDVARERAASKRKTAEIQKKAAEERRAGGAIPRTTTRY